MSKDQIGAFDILQQPGSNNRLNIISVEEFNYSLNIQPFLDVVQLRYQHIYQFYQHGNIVAKNSIHVMQ